MCEGEQTEEPLGDNLDEVEKRSFMLNGPFYRSHRQFKQHVRPNGRQTNFSRNDNTMLMMGGEVHGTQGNVSYLLGEGEVSMIESSGAMTTAHIAHTEYRQN